MRLFVSGSAPLAAHVLEEFRKLYGHTILERYGMSETLMNISNPYIGERRAGTVGLPLPGVSVRLLDRSLATRSRRRNRRSLSARPQHFRRLLAARRCHPRQFCRRLFQDG